MPQHFSHGDLQVGNFLSQSGQLILFDWETAGCRVVYYDVIILECRARLDPFSYVDLIAKIFLQEHREVYLVGLDFKIQIPDFCTNKAFAVFLALENLLYYFEESRFNDFSDGALRYINCLESFISILVKDELSDG